MSHAKCGVIIIDLSVANLPVNVCVENVLMFDEVTEVGSLLFWSTM